MGILMLFGVRTVGYFVFYSKVKKGDVSFEEIHTINDVGSSSDTS